MVALQEGFQHGQWGEEGVQRSHLDLATPISPAMGDASLKEGLTMGKVRGRRGGLADVGSAVTASSL